MRVNIISKKSQRTALVVVLLAGLCSCEEKHTIKNLDWRYAGGDQGVSRYSPLDQINNTNVKKLKVAWTFHSGDNTQYSTIECNPIIINGILYGTTPKMSVVALNAATGEKIWSFNLYKPGASGGGVNRGIALWNNGPEGSRILFSASNKLYALNAVTGRPIQEFGAGGYVDMRYGLDRPVDKISISAPAAPVIYKNLVIMGSMGAAPGDVRAYNVITGKMEWTFHTIPHPGEYGAETWSGDAWKTLYGANVWGGMSIDEKEEWCSLQQALLKIISMAESDWEIIYMQILWWLSMPTRANGSGIFRNSITISGTWTFLVRPTLLL